MTSENCSELLKLYPKFDKNVADSFVSGDETCVHFSKPKCKECPL